MKNIDNNAKCSQLLFTFNDKAMSYGVDLQGYIIQLAFESKEELNNFIKTLQLLTDKDYNNQDNLYEAINNLNDFMHNFCMNCTETAKKNEPVFNCKQCVFQTNRGKCLIKQFVIDKLGKLPDNFGSMVR